ncbi:hypothetical protein J6590_020176 [Homalodisca vitripennis]|nr:hypothetical protein J6590_020176 [Homalodisca vitripennis]
MVLALALPHIQAMHMIDPPVYPRLCNVANPVLPGARPRPPPHPGHAHDRPPVYPRLSDDLRSSYVPGAMWLTLCSLVLALALPHIQAMHMIDPQCNVANPVLPGARPRPPPHPRHAHDRSPVYPRLPPPTVQLHSYPEGLTGPHLSGYHQRHELLGPLRLQRGDELNNTFLLTLTVRASDDKGEKMFKLCLSTKS